jgi:hypothetical protein
VGQQGAVQLRKEPEEKSQAKLTHSKRAVEQVALKIHLVRTLPKTLQRLERSRPCVTRDWERDIETIRVKAFSKATGSENTTTTFDFAENIRVIADLE